MSRIQQVAANITAAAASIGIPGTVTPWLFLDFYETPFDLSLMVTQDNAGANTLAIDYIVGDPTSAMKHQALISQATTVITVQESGPPIPLAQGGNLGHGLAVDDYVLLLESPGGIINGAYSVATVTGASSYTLTGAVSQTVAAFTGSVQTGQVLVAGATGDKIIGASGAGITARTVLPVTAPIVAARLRCTTFSAAAVARLIGVQGGVSS